MNIAFSAVIISILAVPGYLFWYGYSFQERVYAGAQWDSTFALVIKGIVTSIFLHAIWIVFCTPICWLMGTYIDLKSALALAAAAYGDNERYFILFNDSLNAVVNYPFRVIIYFGTLYCISLVAGVFLRWLVVRYRLDETVFPMLKYCDWYKLFDENPLRASSESSAIVFIAATVSHHDGTYLYRGFLSDYALSDDRNLKKLTLESASRRRLCDDRKVDRQQHIQFAAPDPYDPRFYRLTARYAVIEYEKVSTMSIQYLQVRRRQRDQPAAIVSI